ncbi:MAG: hypothetical protein FWE98_00305 [Oscillospiraceae bacterium]|nr:hypothetical protein [Oscillospiraceae bacterium]
MFEKKAKIEEENPEVENTPAYYKYTADLLRPFEASDDAPQPGASPEDGGGAPAPAATPISAPESTPAPVIVPVLTQKPALSQSEREWQLKLDRESRRRSGAKLQLVKPAPGPLKKLRLPRINIPWPKPRPRRPARREPVPAEVSPGQASPGPSARPAQKAARRLDGAAWAEAAAQIVPCAVLLLAAPLISGAAGFYILVLLTAVPAVAALLLLRPLGRWSWPARALAPLLPVELWFALRIFAWEPALTLVLFGIFALVGSMCYLFLRAKLPTEDNRKKNKVQRRFLLFIVPLLGVSLLVPALLGLRLELYRPSPNEISAFEEQSKHSEEDMTRRMLIAYGALLPEGWAKLKGRGEKLEALQNLLDVETDRMEIPRFDLRDPMVSACVGGAGHTGVPAALLSGNAKAEVRVRAMCHLAFHLKQLTIAADVNLRGFEDLAKKYEDHRYQDYVLKWENQPVEVDHE